MAEERPRGPLEQIHRRERLLGQPTVVVLLMPMLGEQMVVGQRMAAV
jgi:hypothetical protein